MGEELVGADLEVFSNEPVRESGGEGGDAAGAGFDAQAGEVVDGFAGGDVEQATSLDGVGGGRFARPGAVVQVLVGRGVVDEGVGEGGEVAAGQVGADVPVQRWGGAASDEFAVGA